MTQHSFTLVDQTHTNFRTQNNLALKALASNNEGATEPATRYAQQWWPDTTSGTLKQRNAANDAWIVRATLAATRTFSRSSNTILGIADYGCFFVATAGFTQTLTAAATLGSGWYCDYRIESGATIVFDPNASENIDGATTKTVIGPASGTIYCTGSAFLTIAFSSASAAGITLGTPVATTSSTSIDFTAIPAGTKRITIMFAGVSADGTSAFMAQLGDAGGIETSGYLSAVTGTGVQALTSGLILMEANVASRAYSGMLVLCLENSSSFTWVATCVLGETSGGDEVNRSVGYKSTSAELTQVRITTVSGGDTFDAGSINISYER